MAEPTRTQARAAEIRLRWLTLVAFLAPLLVLVAVFGSTMETVTVAIGLSPGRRSHG